MNSDQYHLSAMAAGSGFLTLNVRPILLLVQTLSPTFPGRRGTSGGKRGGVRKSVPCQPAVLSTYPLWLSLKEVLELPIGRFRKELHIPTDDERWSVQTDASTSASVQDFSEKCSVRLTFRSTEEIHEEAINAI